MKKENNQLSLSEPGEVEEESLEEYPQKIIKQYPIVTMANKLLLPNHLCLESNACSMPDMVKFAIKLSSETYCKIPNYIN